MLGNILFRASLSILYDVFFMIGVIIGLIKRIIGRLK